LFGRVVIFISISQVIVFCHVLCHNPSALPR
jgi:hypothetical protein